MQRSHSKCVECGNKHDHRPGCSYGPSAADREAFIKDNAVGMVHDLEAVVRSQRKELRRLNRKVDGMRKALDRKDEEKMVMRQQVSSRFDAMDKSELSRRRLVVIVCCLVWFVVSVMVMLKS